LVPPRSFLQLIYPCDQYNPDACLWCGGTYKDHVLLAWSKNHLYSPFDLHIDQIKDKATSWQITKVWNDVPPDVKTIYGYHKRYVLDTEDLLKGLTNQREQRRRLKATLVERYGDEHVAAINKFGVRYVLPRFPHLHVLREIVESRLNQLIEMQQFENEVIDLKKHGECSRAGARRVKAKLKRNSI